MYGSIDDGDPRSKNGEEGEILREGESGLPARPPNEEGELRLGDRSSSRSIACRSGSIAQADMNDLIREQRSCMEDAPSLQYLVLICFV